MGRISVAGIQRELAGRSARAIQWLSLRRRFGRDVISRPLFVVGCQRSGTNMVMWTLEKSPELWVYHEHHRSAAFRDYRLRPTPIVDRLIRRCPAPVVAFKPVCDSHLTDRHLERHRGSRAIWIYRHYADVANSAVRNFGAHQRDMMQWIARGDTDWLGWRGERVAGDIVELIQRCFSESMKYEEAASLFWYMRSRLYFDLGLDRDERVLLVRYEDLVKDRDGTAFRRIFEFAGVSFEPSLLDHVFGTSVGKDQVPEIDSRIRVACDELLERLDLEYGRVMAREAPGGESRESGAKPNPARLGPVRGSSHGR